MMAIQNQHRVYIPTNARTNHYLLAEITPTTDFSIKALVILTVVMSV